MKVPGSPKVTELRWAQRKLFFLANGIGGANVLVKHPLSLNDVWHETIMLYQIFLLGWVDG